jgi:hypothetical protein
MPWRWKWLRDVVKLAHVMMEELIVIKVEEIKMRLGSMNMLQVWRTSWRL